ncbi:MAG: monovalent cation/H+ antiporter complex subunit F [Myxococcota bacterium]
MSELEHVFLGAAMALAVIALIYLYRVLRGPSTFDRLLGLAGIGTKAILILVLIGAIYGQLDMVVDIALGYALINFVASLAAARYAKLYGGTET